MPTKQIIPIADPVWFNQMKNNSLKTVQIGRELIRYGSVSEEEPWRWLKCRRGAYQTEAASHTKGVSVAKLMDHAYKVFLTDAELSLEVARRLADLFNQTGLRQISFDGLEGNWSTGMGQYGRTLFVTTWYDHLDDRLRGKVITDASNPGHYFWHIYTRMNWGEPWYAGFRESQTEYRLKNQDYFRRNLMPCMLGWFNMTGQTSLEDIEWLLARAAGFGRGVCVEYRSWRRPRSWTKRSYPRGDRGVGDGPHGRGLLRIAENVACRTSVRNSIWNRWTPIRGICIRSIRPNTQSRSRFSRASRLKPRGS